MNTKNFLDKSEGKVLLTGANGFLGSEIQKFISKNHLITLGLKDCDINTDISNSGLLSIPFKLNKIIHAAGKAHIIPKTTEEINSFHEINVGGTKNLLNSINQANAYPSIFIYISSVAVYGLDEGLNIEETTPLNGMSPYAKSKIEAEKIIIDWGKNNGVKVLILRLPLLVGWRAPGNFGNMVNAIKKGYYFRVGVGSSKRSMVLVEDVAKFVISIENTEGVYHLTDGYDPSFYEVETLIAKKFHKRIGTIPHSIAMLSAKLGDAIPLIPINSLKLKKITSDLTFSDNKARVELNWDPSRVIDKLSI